MLHLTSAEQILYTACEVRAAAATGDLIRRLHVKDPCAVFQGAIKAFTTIGALQYVCELQRAANDYSGSLTAYRRRRCLATLEAGLLGTQEPIDELIALYAEICHSAGGDYPAENPLSATLN